MAGAEVTQLPNEDAEALSEHAAMELDLKGLSFKEKWDVIGCTNSAAFLRTEAPPCPLTGWNHEGQQFAGMVASVKLNNCDLSRRSAVRAAASLPCLPHDVRRQMKYLRETGSPFRVHCKLPPRLNNGEVLYQMNNGSIPRPDHITNVEDGMEEMWLRYEARHGARQHHPHHQQQPSIASQPTMARMRKSTSRMSLNNKKLKISPMAAMVALSEFRRWCVDNFHDMDHAWEVICCGKDKLAEDEFVDALQDRGYHSGDAEGEAARIELFSCLAANEVVVTEESFHNALDTVSVGRTTKRESMSSLSKPLVKQDAANDMDPVEALAVGADDAESHSSLQQRQKGILDRLRRTDAPVAEAIEYMFTNFGTLKLAFRQMDINGNGLLSSQEFCDGLLGMKSKRAAGPIEVHMKNLYARLDYAGKGSLPLEDLIVNLEKDTEQMATRFMKFVQEVRKRANRCSQTHENTDATTKNRQYARMFKVGAGTSVITLEGFIHALDQLKYPSWHANELFRRLDSDDSGALSLAEFTAFLQKEPPVRNERKGPVKPLGNEFRKQQVEQMYISSATSCKLDGLQSRKTQSEAGSPVMKLMRRGNNDSAKFLLMGLKQDKDGRFERPDWCAHVEEGLLQNREDRYGSRFLQTKPTEFSRTGKHVLRVHAASAPDLIGMGCATANFNEQEQRCRIDAF